MPNLKRYTEDEAKAGMELAIAVGRRQAVKALGISNSTFQKWTVKYAQYWSDLKAGDPEAERKGFSKGLEELAQDYMVAEQDLIDQIQDGKFKPENAKEAAALIKAMGSSRQTATVGARSVAGEHEVVEHNINFPQIEAAMERILSAQAPQTALPVPNEAE
jgi:hypothetical protein